ncbi:MAG: hypothetical protein ABI330_16630 [Caldimonas sp.]
MTVIKAAAVQLSPVLYSREGTVDKVVKTILGLKPRAGEPSLQRSVAEAAIRRRLFNRHTAHERRYD